MFDLVTVGHFVMDLILSPRIEYPKITVGGPAAYVSLAARKLGARVSVISKVGKDFENHLSWLRENEVDLTYTQIIENAHTTSFTLTYNNGNREIQLKTLGPRILPSDIPSFLRAKVIHLAPVANEFSPQITQILREKATLLSIDPQGFLRKFSKIGNMKMKSLEKMGFLEDCDIFKSSITEIKAMTGKHNLETAIGTIKETGVNIVLVTMGKRGALAHFDNGYYHIPPCKARPIKDSTGAGDAFIGAFLAEYIQDNDPLWCCCVGSAAASFTIEEVGSEGFGDRKEVYGRATKIYEKGIKPLSHKELVRDLFWEESAKV